MKMEPIQRFFISLFLISSFMGGVLFAQDQPSAEDIVAKMQSKLNLTQDQVAAVTPIIEKYASKREELRQGMDDGTADRDKIRAQMKQLREDEKQDLSQVLSADQLNQWASSMQGQHKHKHGGDAGDSSGSNTESGGQGGGE